MNCARARVLPDAEHPDPGTGYTFVQPLLNWRVPEHSEGVDISTEEQFMHFYQAPETSIAYIGHTPRLLAEKAEVRVKARWAGTGPEAVGQPAGAGLGPGLGEGSALQVLGGQAAAYSVAGEGPSLSVGRLLLLLLATVCGEAVCPS